MYDDDFSPAYQQWSPFTHDPWPTIEMSTAKLLTLVFKSVQTIIGEKMRWLCQSPSKSAE